MNSVLFVDDEVRTLELLQDLFSDQKIVYTAADEASALEILTHNRIDEMIIDLLLANGKYGYDVAVKVRTLYPKLDIKLMSSMDKDFIRQEFGSEFVLISKVDLVLTAPTSIAPSIPLTPK